MFNTENDSMPKKETPIEKLLRVSEGVPKIAEKLKISHQFCYVCIERGWFPPKRATQLEKLYGVPRKQLMNPELVAVLS